MKEIHSTVKISNVTAYCVMAIFDSNSYSRTLIPGFSSGGIYQHEVETQDRLVSLQVMPLNPVAFNSPDLSGWI